RATGTAGAGAAAGAAAAKARTTPRDSRERERRKLIPTFGTYLLCTLNFLRASPTNHRSTVISRPRRPRPRSRLSDRHFTLRLPFLHPKLLKDRRDRMDRTRGRRHRPPSLPRRAVASTFSSLRPSIWNQHETWVVSPKLLGRPGVISVIHPSRCSSVVASVRTSVPQTGRH
ncbi:hypothetical protein CSHISOI_06117, partial [Colletotrichum shisoi]